MEFPAKVAVILTAACDDIPWSVRVQFRSGTQHKLRWAGVRGDRTFEFILVINQLDALNFVLQ